MLMMKDFIFEEIKKLENKIYVVFVVRYDFSVEDCCVVFIFSVVEEYQDFINFFVVIKIFVWFVGFGSIIVGVIGISNIMLIVVKDWIWEIGVCKVLGVMFYFIIFMILQEAVFIMVVVGYLGFLVGVGVISLMELMEVDFFCNFQVDLGVGLAVILVLVIVGVLAGWMFVCQVA